MIIDYKNELIHQHTALKTIIFSFKRFIENLNEFNSEIEDGAGYLSTIQTILGCIASSHKLDHIRLCCDEKSKQNFLNDSYGLLISGKLKESVSVYQTAHKSSMVDGLKPYQIINGISSGIALTETQNKKGTAWVKGIQDAFYVIGQKVNLQVGQRLYRGATLSKTQLNDFRAAITNGQKKDLSGFISTSLSESIALCFAILSYVRWLENTDIEIDNPHIPVVFELTNRKESLNFLMPDALRLPHRSQGQMEVLLQGTTQIKPTYIDYQEGFIKIYADILN